MKTELRQILPGTYRITLTPNRFGQVKKVGREWHAEVRETTTGKITRFAGIWSSLKDAVEELTTINPLDL